MLKENEKIIKLLLISLNSNINLLYYLICEV